MKAIPRTGVDGDEPGNEPRLVKTKRFAVKPMTVDEAILQMEMLGHSFFFFENADTGDAAVVYRRTDGDIGMIEREGLIRRRLRRLRTPAGPLARGGR